MRARYSYGSRSDEARRRDAFDLSGTPTLPAAFPPERESGERWPRLLIDRGCEPRDTRRAMSRDNVALFRRVSDAYNRRDVDAFLELAHPEVEWHPAFQVLLGGEAAVYRRHDGMRQRFREVDEALSAIDAEWVEVRDLGERIVATGRLHIRGRESGAETEAPVAAWSTSPKGRCRAFRPIWTQMKPSTPRGCESKPIKPTRVIRVQS